MVAKIGNQKLNYEKYGKGKSILMLHGWGGSLQSLKNLANEISGHGYETFLLDLPGFGKSPKPERAFSLDDYAEVIEIFSKKYVINEVIIFGHSFGGAISIKIAGRKKIPVKSLILCNSSGIRYPQGLKIKILENISRFSKRIFGISLLKGIYRPLRKLFYYYILGERDYIDYEEISGTFKKVVKEDLRKELKRIDIPTLIIWGKKDRSTPLEQGKILHTEIKNSKLIVLKKFGHGIPKTHPRVLSEVIRDNIEFIK